MTMKLTDRLIDLLLRVASRPFGFLLRLSVLVFIALLAVQWLLQQ